MKQKFIRQIDTKSKNFSQAMAHILRDMCGQYLLVSVPYQLANHLPGQHLGNGAIVWFGRNHRQFDTFLTRRD